MPVAERSFRVQQNDVDVPENLPVLERVVADQHIGVESLNGCLSGQRPLRAGDHRNAGQRPGDQQRFVARLRGALFYVCSVGYDPDRPGMLAAVSAAEDGRPVSVPHQHFCQSDYAGGFAGSADGQISDADHRTGEPDGLQHLPVVKTVAGEDDQPVNQGAQMED